MAPTGGEDQALPFAKHNKIEESAHLQPPILAGHDNDPAAPMSSITAQNSSPTGGICTSFNAWAATEPWGQRRV